MGETHHFVRIVSDEEKEEWRRRKVKKKHSAHTKDWHAFKPNFRSNTISNLAFYWIVSSIQFQPLHNTHTNTHTIVIIIICNHHHRHTHMHIDSPTFTPTNAIFAFKQFCRWIVELLSNIVISRCNRNCVCDSPFLLLFQKGRFNNTERVCGTEKKKSRLERTAPKIFSGLSNLSAFYFIFKSNVINGWKSISIGTIKMNGNWSVSFSLLSRFRQIESLSTSKSAVILCIQWN